MARSTDNTPRGCSGPLGWATRAPKPLVMAKAQPKDIQRTSLFPSSKTLSLVVWETMFSVSVAPGLCCQTRLSHRGAAYERVGVGSPADVCGTTQERAGRDVPVLNTPGRNKSASW